MNVMLKSCGSYSCGDPEYGAAIKVIVVIACVKKKSHVLVPGVRWVFQPAARLAHSTHSVSFGLNVNLRSNKLSRGSKTELKTSPSGNYG